MENLSGQAAFFLWLASTSWENYTYTCMRWKERHAKMAGVILLDWFGLDPCMNWIITLNIDSLLFSMIWTYSVCFLHWVYNTFMPFLEKVYWNRLVDDWNYQRETWIFLGRCSMNGVYLRRTYWYLSTCWLVPNMDFIHSILCMIVIFWYRMEWHTYAFFVNFYSWLITYRIYCLHELLLALLTTVLSSFL